MSEELKKATETLNGTWNDIKALHADLQESKLKLESELSTFETASGLQKEQLANLNAKMDAMELTIARHKDSIKAAHTPVDSHVEKLWELQAKKLKSKGVELDRAAVKAAHTALAKSTAGVQGIEAEHVKLLSTQDNANGGYLVIPELEAEIDKIMADFGGLRAIARVTQTGTSIFEIVQRTGRPTVDIPGEGSTTNRSNSTFGKIAIPNKRYTARVGATVEEVQDSFWSIEELARVDAAEEFDLQEADDFVNGDGVNEPEGLWVNDDIAEVVSGSAAAITYEGLVRVSHGTTKANAFNRNYLGEARFVMNLPTLGAARLLEDTGNNLIFQPGVADIESSILGFGFTILPEAPVVAANAYPVMFGNFNKGYRIIDRIGLTFLTDPFSSADQGIIDYHFGRRTGGKVVNPSVLRKLKCST